MLPLIPSTDALYLNLNVLFAEQDLKVLMAELWPVVTARGVGAELAIAGFDSDPRELWEIPEVVKFCRKLVDLGFISVLVSSGFATNPSRPILGAFEVWRIAGGSFPGNASTVEEHRETFQGVLQEAHRQGEAIVAAVRQNPHAKLSRPCSVLQVEGSARSK